MNTTLVKINRNLNMKFFNRTSDHKTAKNQIPRRNKNFDCRKLKQKHIGRRLI